MFNIFTDKKFDIRGDSNDAIRMYCAPPSNFSSTYTPCERSQSNHSKKVR